MRKIVIASDSFKGTLTQGRICEIATRVVHEVFGDCEVDCLPIADGGEGSVDCFLTARGGERIERVVCGPDGRDCTAAYGRLDERTAVIEVASCAGLPMLGGRLIPLSATTYGLGQLILDAVSAGARELLLCLGGSATTDAGCGMAAALGYEFYDSDGQSFIPAGGTLKNIARVEGGSAVDLSGVDIRVLCDTKATLYGKGGAAYVYSPQKGASPDEVVLLDEGLRHAAAVIGRDLSVGSETIQMPGGGAAGGLGFGCVAFLGARLCGGIDTVLDVFGFEERISDADLVITGEGRFDSQSLTGKAVYGVSTRARKVGVPCVAVVGSAGYDVDADDLDSIGLSAVFTCNRLPEPLSSSAPHSDQNYEFTLKNVLRVFSGTLSPSP